MNAFLAFAALALLAVVALQDYLVPSLRNATISSGLTGRYHVLLDASYVVLSVALVLAFAGSEWPEVALAVVSAIALLLTAATNTAWRFFDLVTDGGHSKLHSIFTTVVFTAALLLEAFGNHGWTWWLTALNLAAPIAVYVYFATEKTDVEGVVVAASPAAEKLYVAGLCIWLALVG